MCSYPAGCLAWRIPALEPVGCWTGPSLDVKMVTSVRAHANQYSLGPLHPVGLPPAQWSTANPHLPRRLSKTHRSTSSALCWIPVYVSPPRVESLFHPVLWSSCTQACWSSKPSPLEGSTSWCQILSLRSLRWGLELSLWQENLCNIIILQFVGLPLVMSLMHLSYCRFRLLLCLWMQNIFFGSFQSPLSMVVQ